MNKHLLFAFCILASLEPLTLFSQEAESIVVAQTTVKQLVENPQQGIFRIKGRYVKTYDYDNLTFSIEDEDYVIPIRLVKKDLGAVNRFRALNLLNGCMLTVEGQVESIYIDKGYYTGLENAVIIDAPNNISPSFNGGDLDVFSQWVGTKLVYPKIAKENGIQGRVLLSFTIKTDGSVSDVKVLKGVDPVLNEEAVRVVSSSPKWTPGSSNGIPLEVSYSFPVVFSFR